MLHYVYPNSLLAVLSEAMKLSLDSPSLFVEIQGVLSLFPWHAWHVKGFHVKMFQFVQRKEVSASSYFRDSPFAVKGVLSGSLGFRMKVFVS